MVCMGDPAHTLSASSCGVDDVAEAVGIQLVLDCSGCPRLVCHRRHEGRSRVRRTGKDVLGPLPRCFVDFRPVPASR
eukprot:scaffold348_cov329-Pavlova_lutheri.AAC.62